MSVQPAVELTFDPSEVTGLETTGRILGTPEQALTAALHHSRTEMMTEMKHRLERPGLVTAGALAGLADEVWQAIRPSWIRLSVPVIAEIYFKAYEAADAGDISFDAVTALATKHAEDLGDYYHSTSTDAMVEGFTGFVNRKVAAKTAATQVAEAYGLTPRQMRAYVAARAQWTPSISSFTPFGLKREAAKFIVRSLTQRYKNISDQEVHNITEQGKQLAWIWQLSKGDLPAQAEKMWLTAKDERVCPVCGPLHGVKVPLAGQFHTDEGDFYSPGIHPNCRCQLRLMPNTFQVQKDLSGGVLVEFNREHPRDEHGQFSAVARHHDRWTRVREREFQPQFEAKHQRTMVEDREPEREQLTALQRMIDTQLHDPVLEQRFTAVVRSGAVMPAKSKVVSAPKTEAQSISQTEIIQRLVFAAQAQKEAEAAAMPRSQSSTALRRSTSAVPKSKSSLAGAKSSLSQAKSKPTTTVSTATRLGLATSTPVKAKARTQMPTAPVIAGPKTLTKPHYAAVPGSFFDLGGMKQADLFKGITFTASREQAEADAAAQIRQAIAMKLKLITKTYNPNRKIAGQKGTWEDKKHVGLKRHGTTVTTGGLTQYWDMSQDQMRQLADYVAQQAVAENLAKDFAYREGMTEAERKAAVKTPERVEFTNRWKDGNGKVVGQSTFDAAYLAAELGLNWHDFDFRTVEIGQSIDMDPANQTTIPGVHVDGLYRGVRGSVQATEHEGRPITHMRMEPLPLERQPFKGIHEPLPTEDLGD